MAKAPTDRPADAAVLLAEWDAAIEALREYPAQAARHRFCEGALAYGPVWLKPIRPAHVSKAVSALVPRSATALQDAIATLGDFSA